MKTDEIVALVIILGFFAILGGFVYVFTTAKEDDESGSKSSSQASQANPTALRWLPMAFYVIACLGFIGWTIIALNLESGEAFGYGVGTTIACLGSGRVIELLQNIDDKLEQKRTSE